MNIETVDKHIGALRSKFKTTAPRHATYHRDGSDIPNVKYVKSDEDHQKIFNHLKKSGFKKTEGYDPNPNTWSMGHSAERMYSYSDPVHHKDGLSVHISKEHKGMTHVHFSHKRKLKEEFIKEEQITSNVAALEAPFRKIADELKTNSVSLKKRNEKMSNAFEHYHNMYNHLAIQSSLNRPENVAHIFETLDEDGAKFINEILDENEQQTVLEELKNIGIEL